MKLLIWSFGTSDIKYNGGFLRNNFLEETKDIADYIDSKIANVSFPMLDQFILDWHDFDKFVWIYTMQEPLHNQDTQYLINIIKRYPKLSNIKKWQILLSKVQRPDDVVWVLNNFFSSYSSDDEIFINITWGTKGMVLWITLAAINKFPINRIKFYYWEYSANMTNFIEQKSSIQWQHLLNINNLSKVKDYYWIFSYIENNWINNEYSREYAISRYLYHRLNANYEWARNIFVQNALDAKFAINLNNISIIEESLNWIIYCYETWRYLEFLWRVYNFTNNVLNYLLKQYLNIDKDLTYWDLYKLIETDFDFKSYLDSLTVRIGESEVKLNWECLSNTAFLNIHVLWAMIKYYSTKNDMLKNYILIVDKIQRLNQYRNSTLIWHNIESVSKEKIIEKYWSEYIAKDFRNIFNELFPNKQLWIDFKIIN